MDTIISVIGLLLGLSGSIILAFSLNRIIQELNFALQFHDITIGQILSRGDIPHFTGIDERLKSGLTSTAKRTTTGIVFIALGFAIQIIPLLQ